MVTRWSTASTRPVFAFFEVLLATLIFSAGAIWNQFPLVYFDTAQHLPGLSRLPAMRAGGYNVFVSGAGFFGQPLWGTIVLQNAALAFLLREILVRSGIRSSTAYLGGCAFASFGLGAMWAQGQILPDATTAILIVSAILLLEPNARRPPIVSVILWASFSLASSTHYSHPLIVTLGIPLTFLIWKKTEAAFRLRPAIAVLVVAWAMMGITEVTLRGEQKSEPSWHPFALARMYETGTLGRLLREHCAGTDYLFCNLPLLRFPPEKNPVNPNPDVSPPAGWFLWGEQNPMKVAGNVNRPEYRRMIVDVLRYYPWEFFLRNLAPVFRLPVSFTLGEGLKSYKGTFVDREIGRWFPEEHGAFLRARQQTEGLPFFFLRRVQWVAIVCFAVVFVLCVRVGAAHELPGLARHFWGVAALTLANGFVCGFLSGVDPRYQFRVYWIAPLFTVAGFLAWLGTQRRARARSPWYISRVASPEESP